MNSSSNQYFTMNMTSNISPAWQPQAVLNNNMLQDANITSNWKYRQYIQKNASQIMKYNSMEYIYASGNNPYFDQGEPSAKQGEPSANVPHRFSSLHDPSYGFSNSDLKQDFLKKQQMSSRMISPAYATINNK